MTTTSSPFIDKIRKLMAKADGTTNAAEAEAFRAKAMEMMLREGISEALIRDVDTFKVESNNIKLRSTTWREDIMMSAHVAKSIGCVTRYSAYQPGHGARSHFYGTRPQIEAAAAMMEQLMLQRDRASRKRPSHESQREFASGFALGVSRSLAEATAEVVKNDASLLPVLKSMVDKINEHLSAAGKGRMSPARPGAAGIAAGRAADTGMRARLEQNARRAIGS